MRRSSVWMGVIMGGIVGFALGGLLSSGNELIPAVVMGIMGAVSGGAYMESKS
jgi:hypothetical protein